MNAVSPQICIIYFKVLQVNKDRNSATLHQTLQLVALTPRNMFREESKPPAKIRATCGLERSHMMRHANRDTVIRGTLLVPLLSAGIVSSTTKSMADSDDRPTCKDECKNDGL